MSRYVRTSANEFPRGVKLDRFENYAERRCEWDGPPGKEGSEPRCPQELVSGNVIYDHWDSNEARHARGLPPDNSIENCRCLCTGHNKVKCGLESHDRATVRAKKASVYGAKTRKGPPVPGSKESPWMHTVNHGWIRREDHPDRKGKMR